MADSDGLPGHASGGLQIILCLLMVCVEGGVLLEGGIQRDDGYVDMNKMGRFGVVVCTDKGWSWLSNLMWPGSLLCVQTFLSPFIWKSRRNYREGALFSLTSLGCSAITGAWVSFYIFLEGDFKFLELNV